MFCDFILKRDFFPEVHCRLLTFGIMISLHYRNCLSRALSQCGIDKCQILRLATLFYSSQVPGGGAYCHKPILLTRSVASGGLTFRSHCPSSLPALEGAIWGLWWCECQAEAGWPRLESVGRDRRP